MKEGVQDIIDVMKYKVENRDIVVKTRFEGFENDSYFVKTD